MATNRPLTIRQILRWADAHKRRTGQWPAQRSGPVADADGETWPGINTALYCGLRGLPGGSSLARLLEEHRGVPARRMPPPLTADMILSWADAHRGRTGSWPTAAGGPVHDAPGENWRALDSVLRHGGRGMAGGSSLCQLLVRTGRKTKGYARG